MVCLDAEVLEALLDRDADGAATAPEPDLINPFLDYDWGPRFDPNDASGIPDNAPPKIRQTINMLVPRVNSDVARNGGLHHSRSVPGSP